MANVGTHILLQ